MDISTTLDLLRKHQADLQDAGAQHLSVFGSVARGDQGPDSDVDVLATLDPSKDVTLLDVVRLERTISTVIRAPAHVIVEPVQKPRLREAIRRESVRAF